MERTEASNILGKRLSIICVAERARLRDGEHMVKSMDRKRTDAAQFGGIGNALARAIETRVTVLGHLRRGGSPTAFDHERVPWG